MRFCNRIVCDRLARLALLLVLGAAAALRPAHAGDVANALVAEADLAAAFQSGLQLEVAGKPIELASSRVRLMMSDPRDRNQLLAILNDVSFDVPDADDAGNDQSDFSVETVLVLKANGEEVSETASCNWITVEKLQAECSVFDGGGGFLIRIEGRGRDLGSIKWHLVIGEGLSVGFRAGSSTASEGGRVDYILQINGREPVRVPLTIRQ